MVNECAGSTLDRVTVNVTVPPSMVLFGETVTLILGGGTGVGVGEALLTGVAVGVGVGVGVEFEPPLTNTSARSTVMAFAVALGS